VGVALSIIAIVVFFLFIISAETTESFIYSKLNIWLFIILAIGAAIGLFRLFYWVEIHITYL
jgi:hypothetical protein